jgi:hypothetical protein
MLPEHLRPSPLEIACGMIVDRLPEAPELVIDRRTPPRLAFDKVVRRALLRPPCLVSFSGGRDSSAVLAAATALARREGHPLPIPATFRFPGAPRTDEDEWQDGVVCHLGLTDWERVTITDELDSIGPVAQAVLRRYGLVWPFNAHFHVPLMERAAGGSLLTGVGGDDVFVADRGWAARAVLAGRRRPRLRDVAAVGLALSPPAVRAAVLTRRRGPEWPWLRPGAGALVHRQRATWRARTPLPWSAALRWWWRSRTRVVLAGTLDVLAAGAGTHLVQPFLEPSVVSALAGRFGVLGPASRAAALRELFGDVLAENVTSRRTKAIFDEGFFSAHSRQFAATWSGEHVDPSLVDPLGLAASWRAPRPDARSFLLLQAAWLAGAGTMPDRREV